MLLLSGAARELGIDPEQAVLRFGEDVKADGAWAGRRLMWLDGRPAFELSFWCGTCPFLFERLDGATRTLSVAELERRLNAGLDGLDEAVVARFGELLPAGRYLPMLLAVSPRLVHPLDEDDYFAHEQVDTWGLDGFTGLPLHPRIAYYRTFDTAVDTDAHLYEFVVPMVPTTWNDPGRVAVHRNALRRSSAPTAVAVSTMDICFPALGGGRAHYAHWALTHFLLDGHHKFQAAAESGRPLRLLSLLTVDESLAEPHDVARIPTIRGARR